MKDHPLTPMTDSNLVSTLSRQTSQKVGLVEYTNISGGPSEIKKLLISFKRRCSNSCY